MPRPVPHSGTSAPKPDRISYDPIPATARRCRVPRGPSQPQWIAIGIAVGFLLALWLAWFVYTRPARLERHRVERYLDSLPGLRDVSLDVPLFARRLPGTVDVTATGLPSGSYQYEVTVDLQGTYDTHTGKITFKGQKQVLFPYEKVVIDRPETVPPP